MNPDGVSDPIQVAISLAALVAVVVVMTALGSWWANRREGR